MHEQSHDPDTQTCAKTGTKQLTAFNEDMQQTAYVARKAAHLLSVLCLTGRLQAGSFSYVWYERKRHYVKEFLFKADSVVQGEPCRGMLIKPRSALRIAPTGERMPNVIGIAPPSGLCRALQHDGTFQAGAERIRPSVGAGCTSKLFGGSATPR